MNIATQPNPLDLIQQLKTKGQLSARQLKRLLRVTLAVNQAFYIAFRERTFSQPNKPENAWTVKFVCRKLCEALDVEVTLHGVMPQQHALWVSNHISWLDIPVVGSQAKVYLLAKAEIQHWPVIGKLAQAGGTLFIKRGSGDSSTVKDQIAGFLSRKIPVLFFPEATTTNGKTIKRLHGKLLAAAIATQTPVQAMVLAYVNERGELDQVVPYIDDDTFGEHLMNMLALPKIRAHVLPLQAIDSTGHTVESLTELLQARMTEGLVQLHSQVLNH